MHEVSLMRELLTQVKQAMQQNGVERVSSLQIEIGPLAGVEPLLVEQAFCFLIPRTVFEDTRLEVHEPALMAVCQECQRDFEVVDFKFSCPSCLSSKVQITSGDQLRLLSITVKLDGELDEDSNVCLGKIEK